MAQRNPKLYKQIIKWFEASKEEIKEAGIFDDAMTYQQVYENKPWGNLPGMERPEHLTKLKVPIADDVIETGLSVATARVPTPDIDPEIEPAKIAAILQSMGLTEEQVQAIEAEGEEAVLQAFQEKASAVSTAMSKDLVEHWKDSRMQSNIRSAYRVKGIKGTSIIKIYYDGQQKQEEMCDFEAVFPSPGVFSIPGHKDDPFIYAPIRTIRQIKREFNLDEVSPGAVMSHSDAQKVRHPERRTINYYASQVINASQRAINKITGGGITEDTGFGVVLECYMPCRDEYVTVENEEFVEIDGELQIEDGEVMKNKVQTPVQKFPSGYKVAKILYGHDGYILSEEDCPYAPAGHPQPPFVRMAGYLPDNSFWGISEISKIGDLISQVCLVVSNIIDVVRFTGNAPLVLPSGTIEGDALDIGEAEEAADDLTAFAYPGKVYHTPNPAGLKFLQPPSVGVDPKWLIEWIMSMIDRTTHLSDALRGFNVNAQDSGRKIRELRAAAVGTFGPKMDEVVEFVTDIYRMWAWIDNNLVSPETEILQKDEDERGNASFNKYNPSQGKLFKFKVNVSSRALLPDDPDENFNVVSTLYQLLQLPTGGSAVPMEVVVDAAPVNDKVRIKKGVSDSQEKASNEAQKQAAYQELAEMVQTGAIQQPGSGQRIIDLVKAFPDLISTEEFKSLQQEAKQVIVDSLIQENTNVA